LLAKGSVEAVVAEAIEERLHKVRYAKPRDWFQYINEIQKLGCPSDEEVARIVEMKATRDVFEHNSGVANKIYLEKAGSKARFKEGEAVDVPDTYLQEGWALLKKVCADLAAAEAKVLAIK
jgi:hypothetical protein